MAANAELAQASCADGEELRRSVEALPEPPDGGVGWLQVVVAYLELSNTFGYMNSYGIFEQYYHPQLGYSLSSISWIGSIQVFLLLSMGILFGRLFDAGARLVYCPVMVSVSTYFSKRRALVIAVVTSGTATGGVIFPIIAQRLLYRAGFPWTIRFMGFVVLFNAVIVILLVRDRLPPRSSGPLLDLAAFRELPYALFTVGVFLCLWVVYIGYDYVSLGKIHLD
ncbi:MFS-type transporter [Cladobotryum mycophilum]|uniref:MFS-type transporter n=1 Tax=Cladobotryum mycophilum TaxID=491253 RepID=A0ABR0SHI3_9HYPO